jgi:hypothetical protein
MRKVDPDVLLSPCELANALNRSERYVRHMKEKGFEMVGNRATLNQAIEFLKVCPKPGSKNYTHGGPN